MSASGVVMGGSGWTWSSVVKRHLPVVVEGGGRLLGVRHGRGEMGGRLAAEVVAGAVDGRCDDGSGAGCCRW